MNRSETLMVIPNCALHGIKEVSRFSWVDSGMILDARMHIFKSVLTRSKPGFLLLVMFTRCVLSRNSQEIALLHWF